MKVSPRCRRCGQPETLEHALMECPCLKAFWQQVQLLINKINGQTIPLTESLVLLGFGLCRNAKKAQLIKFITDCAKRSCWKNRVSHNFVKNTLMDTGNHFKHYVRTRLRCAWVTHSAQEMQDTWCINDALASLHNGTFNIRI